MSTQCQLCGVTKPTQQLNRNSGLAMCDQCHGGEIHAACHNLGMDYQISRSHRVVPGPNNSSTTYHYLEITSRYPRLDEPFKGHFSRESAIGFLRTILDTVGLGDPKVGDDDNDGDATADDEGEDRLVDAPKVSSAEINQAFLAV